MKRPHFLLVTASALLLSNPVFSQEETEINRFLKNSTSGSIQNRISAAQELGRSSSIEEMNAVRSGLSAEKSFEKIQASYLEEQRRARTGMAILKANNLILKSALSYAGAAASGPYAAITKTALDYVADESLGKLEDWIEGQLQEKSETTLKATLSLYRKRVGIESLENLTPRQIVSTLDETGYLPEQKIDPKIDQAGRLIVMESLIRELAGADRKILNELADQGDRIGTVEEIQATHKDAINELKVISSTIWKATIDHGQRLTRIEGNVLKLRDKMRAMSNRVEQNEQGIMENTRDIEFLQQSMFGQMTPKQQQAALATGFFKSMPTKERAELKERVEIAVLRKEIADDISEVAGYAENFRNIAQNFGLSGSAMDTLSTASSLGSIAQGAANAWASGNVIGMVSSLSNIFGIGSPSPEAQRHKQIVGMLKGVLKNQSMMMESLERIEKRQEAIIHNQQTIITNIAKLSEQVAKQHKELLDALDQIRDEVRVNRNGIRDLLVGEIESCDDIVSHYPNPATTLKEAAVRFDLTFPEFYRTCLRGLASIVGGVGVSDSAFDANWWLNLEKPESEQKNDEFLKYVWRPYWNYIKDITKVGETSLDEIIASALVPAIDAKALKEKYTYLESTDETLLPDRFSAISGPTNRKISDLFEDYYSLEASEWILRHLLRFYSFWELYNKKDDRILTTKEYLEATVLPLEAKVRLTSGLIRSDILVVQQALLSGDMVIPVSYKIFTELDLSNKLIQGAPGVHQGLYGILATNPIFARNFVMYLIKESLERKGSSLLQYHFSVNLPEDRSNELKSIFKFGEKMSLHRYDRNSPESNVLPSNTDWCIEIGKVCIGLPNSAEVLLGNLHYSSDYDAVTQLQAELIDNVIGYDLWTSKIASEERDAMARILLLSSDRHPQTSFGNANMRAPD